MTEDFRDPSEEMKRLLRRIEEIDEAQQVQLPQAQSLEQFDFGERTRPVSDSADQGKPALRRRGKQVGLRVWREFRRRRLIRTMTIAGIVAVVLAAILLDTEPKVQPPLLATLNRINSEPAKQPHALATVALQKTSLQSDQVWPIGLPTAPGSDGTLVIKGLAVGATLSVGRPLNANSWELKAKDLNGAFIIPPSGFAGTMDLTIDLSLGGTTVDEQRMQVEWVGTTSAAPQVSTIRMEPGDITRLLTRGEALLASGEIAAARAMFKRLADNGEPRAALALAQTYEQSTLDRLGARGLAPEIEMARAWYERAKELGSTEAQRRLDALANRSK
ncbi:MAG TPA: hypothetical protein VLJ17_00330 [Xanthobacteraceae bacterium]|nr:hypothetical protein [Xanthobacteraceae bacterium]